MRKGTRSACSLQRARDGVRPQRRTAFDSAIDGDRFRRLGAPAHPGLWRLRHGRNQLREKIRPRPPEVGTWIGRRIAETDGKESGAHGLRFLFRNGTAPLWRGTQTPCRELRRKARAAPADFPNSLSWRGSLRLSPPDSRPPRRHRFRVLPP
jgi:hypothetical protein